MTLFDKPHSRANSLTHPQSRHHNGNPSSTKCAHRKLILHLAELGSGVDYTHEIEFLQQTLFMEQAVWIGGV